MIFKKIDLARLYPNLGYGVLTSYCPCYKKEMDPHHKRKTVLILPGGGYQFVSEREGEPVALRFASFGFNAFVLDYPVGDIDFPTPLLHVLASLDFIRRHGRKYNVDTNSIFVMGFSAGGHLAGITGLYHKESRYLDIINAKPTKLAGIILAYPVITMFDKAQTDTRNTITKGKEELKNILSIERNIKKGYPPTFVWTTKEDTCVPYENSVLFKQAMDDKGNECEFVLYPHCDHGGSLNDETVFFDKKACEVFKQNSDWPLKARDFMLRHRYKKPRNQ